MSIHKLTAGSGYDYLTRQVAAMDATEKGHTSLATYYTDHGETPGQWIGSGIAGIDGLAAGDPVTAEQMKALFGYGFHPLADARTALLEDTASEVEFKRARQLGTPFKVFEADVPPYRIEVARRLEDLNVEAGRPREAPVPLEERAQMRTAVAREYFVREHGREPADARELASAVALYSRPKTTAVAGYDLTFSPVKSVSTLWAIADVATAAAIERAHNAAVKDALAFLEREALYTRVGHNGVQQVDVRGLVAAAFTHRDSRAGDPDLHTHVAVANKVQTVADGKWLAIDGRLMFKATVAASEAYNTALERHLETSLGVRFEERENTDRRKRPVREIVGVDPQLNERWSTRRQSIEARRDVLVAKFLRDHGRPPTAVEAVQLAQQATLETRDAKHEPRSLPEQRPAWAMQAADVLGPGGTEQMVSTALRPPPLSAETAADRRVDAAWVERTAARVVGEVQGRQSTWQRWQIVAEVQRHVRGTDVNPEHIQHMVGLVEDRAISLCQPLTTAAREFAEPQELRRLDRSSVYEVAGSTLYTSSHILEAEERIVDAAGHRDRRRVEPIDVDLALLESTAHGVELNAGQAAMVRGMATSGARVQLGIAAAGTGKTTTMSVLTRAWQNTGGNVIGLAPSAAAAAALREQTGTTTDTLAKLVDTLRRESVGRGGKDLLGQIGAKTLVIIDEAGMADTLSLDAAITAILDRGASVRLIGDDQQLAAIGAGGVLRDIGDRHGSLKLAELMRFSDSAEGAATLALREGLPEAFGYYFDCQRIHVGDVATLTDDIFTAWHHDRTAGKDAVMLAPTRDLVTELNARARTARLTETSDGAGREAALSDGNSASIGDVVLTRHNDRRLRVSASDWVKNGDRWRVEDVHGTALRVRHVETGLRVLLPPAYVAEHTELGYASTVHTAQGISADTMHGLVTGDQTRQQLYTMMSRGRQENHAYVVVTSEGDPHGLIRPEALRPPTAGDVLTTVLARDESPRSATGMLAEANTPTTQLRRVTERYADAIYVAAAGHLGTDVIAGIEAQAEVLLPGITEETAWPALRSHLLLLQASGTDAVAKLGEAFALRDVESADDRAAVLDWRLDPTGRRDTNPGPLPWLPATPTDLAGHPTWGPYLGGLDDRIRTLAAEVHAAAADADAPSWARHARLAPAADIAGDVAVWRAATGVADTDRRPTGPRQLQKAAVLHQRELEARLDAGRRPAMDEWCPAIHELHPRTDSFTPLLAERLAAISRSGVNAADLLAQAAGEGPLPDEHVAAALWWRITRHLTPAVAAEQTAGDGRVAPDWGGLLLEHLGVEEAAAVTSSPWWPTLVATIDQAHDRGWPIEQLLDLSKSNDTEDLDLAQAMIWRIALVTDPPPEDDHGVPEENLPPADLHELEPLDHEAAPVIDELAAAARDRDLLEPAQATGIGVGDLIDRAWELQASAVPVERINAINAAASDYFEAQFPDSWARVHVHERLGVDLAGDERFRPGYAPPGWTNLTDHLRTRGFTDEDLVAAGVAKEASTGRLIDRFRDRAILPVITGGRVIGFVGRRNPDTHGDLAGPKYLNSPDTIVFHKGAQLYGIADDHMTHGAVPALAEGPFDAIAITIASGGAFVGVAPLGTSTTAQQAAQLAGLHDTPLIATDGDLAGRIAAERDLWLLAPHLVTPRVVPMPVGADPASLLEQRGPARLVALLQQHRDLPELLINERLTNLTDQTDRSQQIAEIIAVTEPTRWRNLIASAASAGGVDTAQLRADVAQAARSFNHDPHQFAADKIGHISDVRRRLEGHDRARPADRWAALGRSLDPRLTAGKDWPATAALLHELHDQGSDVEWLTRQVVARAPLGDNPSRDLRYRLVEHLEAGSGSAPTMPPLPSRERKPSPRTPIRRPDWNPPR